MFLTCSFSNATKSLDLTTHNDLTETAFAIATDIVLADGEVTEEEQKLLNDLFQLLEIPEETAIKIIDVMLIKNQG